MHWPMQHVTCPSSGQRLARLLLAADPANPWHCRNSAPSTAPSAQGITGFPARACIRRSQSTRATTMQGSTSLHITGPLEYTTLAQPTRTEIEVKKSRFVVTAWPVSSSKQALALIRDQSDPSASHNCYAIRAGGEQRSSDDGEPSGTAGRPILSAIEGEELEGVAVLVTRYFGGIKLGAGGLVRAYGNAARTCLRAAPRTVVRARIRLRFRAPYQLLGVVYNLVDKYECERLAEDYEEVATGSSGGDGEEGLSVVLVVSVEADRASALAQAVQDGTSGQVQCEQVTEDESAEQEQR